jgi:aminodeoxyfutalosine deaminase
VNTDDPKMFQTSMAEEYRQLGRVFGFAKPEICRLVLNGIQSSWLSEERKRILTEQFRKAPSWSEKAIQL